VSGQDLSCQRRSWFWSPVVYVAPLRPDRHGQSDEKTTQNDEITTHDSSLRKSRRYDCRAFDLSSALSLT
jgi:hypothetical protein